MATQMIDGNTESKDKSWLAAWVGLVLALATLPFLWAWLVTPAGQQFTGWLFNANDGNTYLAKMEEGRQGAWVFRLAHTSEQGDTGAITYEFYLILGKLAGLLNLPNIIIFHAARLGCGLFLLLVSYRFITLLFVARVQQRFAFTLVGLAAGLGWLTILFEPNPPDFWVAEAYTFQSIFANPHFPLATGLLIVAITEMMLAFEAVQHNWQCFLKAAIAALGLGFVHPFLLAPLLAVPTLGWLRQSLSKKSMDWRGLIGLGVVGVSSTPGAILTWWGIQSDPLLQDWMRQNQTPTLNWLDTLLGYGLLVPLAGFGVWWVIRVLPRHQQQAKPINANPLINRWHTVTNWLLVSIVLLTLPLSFSRRFLEGVHLPLCCLAAVGCYNLLLPLKWRKTINWGLVGLMSLTTLAFVGISVALIYLPHDSLTDPVRAPYLSAGEIGAIQWLRQYSQPEEVVLTGPILGNLLPGQVPIHVFYGHSMETLNANQKLTSLKHFFVATTTTAERTNLISEWHLKYLLYGWREQRLGSFDPNTGGWPLLYSQNNVRIYLLNASNRFFTSLSAR